MRAVLDDYKSVATVGAVELLLELAKRLKGRRMLHVNSTQIGGGVAEILMRLIFLLEELGIETRWEVMKGTDDFFVATKTLHNALQGWGEQLSPAMLETYLEVNRENARAMVLEADTVIIHDPQPAALINFRPPRGRWVWRCHIDLSGPDRETWSFLRPHVVKFDAAIFSHKRFAQRLPIPQFLIHPSIDPFSDKNRELTEAEVAATLVRLKVPQDKPILLQVSRFDRFKDPLGLIAAFRIIRATHDCYLVLAGGSATDDPEGQAVFERVQEEAAGDQNILALMLSPSSHLEINALQRAATVVFQKSLREGFGLVVTEAMWKAKPVVAGLVGGIAAQIIHGVTGYSVHSIEGAAFWGRHLLNNPDVARHIGDNAREFVRRNFLITRHLRDYLTLMLALEQS